MITKRLYWLVLSCLLLSACGQDEPAQGFAGLGTQVDGFAQVSADTRLTFPEDFGKHPEYRIEWWYITANLTGSEGEVIGAQWTLFRQALTPGPERHGWANQHLWLGHAAITRSDLHYAAETYARGGVGQAGVDMAPFKAWIDDWQLQSTTGDLNQLSLSARGDNFSYNLTLSTEADPVLQGDKGFSLKSDAGQASHYFSQPFFTAEGQVQIDEQTYAVTGQAWMDREWSSQPLAADQQGWDWFSMHLNSGDKLMLFRLRHTDGAHYYSGTWISAEGVAQPLSRDQIQMKPGKLHPVAGRRVPTSWQLAIPHLAVQLQTQAINPDAWMDTSIPYWEGPIQISGSHSGIGYLEMTGY